MTTFEIILLLVGVGALLFRLGRRRRGARAEALEAERIKHEEGLEALRPQRGPYDLDGRPVYGGWFYHQEAEDEQSYLHDHPENRVEQQHLRVSDDTVAFLERCKMLVEQAKGDIQDK